jgi:threonine dehydrogenase-like Zn-dependent dehydrogenase
MPEAMLAALDNGKQKYDVKAAPMPEMFPGAALIRVRQTGICGSDLHMTRERNEAQKVPSGHEVAGEVVELPRGEKRLKVGDRVAIEMIGHGRACGVCYFCRMGQFRHCQDRVLDTGGGFAEYMSRRPAGLYRLDDRLDWTDGALVEPLAVSVHALRYGGMKPGDTVAVVGSHTIGLAAIAAAKAFGAKKVIASAKYRQQAEHASALGADVVTGTAKGELEDAVKSATGGLGADVVVETVGGHSIDTLNQSVAACRGQGKVLIIGVFREPLKFDFLPPIITELTFLFSSCYGVVDGRHDYETSIDLMAGGKAPLKRIVTHLYPLKDIQKGFDTAFDKNTGSIKVHITQ